MDETGTDVTQIQSENDEAIARLASIDPNLAGQAAQIAQSHYLLTLLEHQLRWSSGERGLEAARLAHAEWMRDTLERTEVQVRERMLTSIGNGAPSSPFPNREARRHPA